MHKEFLNYKNFLSHTDRIPSTVLDGRVKECIMIFGLENFSKSY